MLHYTVSITLVKWISLTKIIYKYHNAEAMYGAAFTSPTKYVSFSESEPIPNSLGKDKFAPLDPVWSQPLEYGI